MSGLAAGSIRRKLMVVVLATTLLSLAMSSLMLFLYDVRSHQKSWENDLATQARLLALASVAALDFDDPEAARDNLTALRVRPHILAAALYAANGTMFASYRQAGVSPRALPSVAPTRDEPFDGDQRGVFQPIVRNGDVIGVVYLRAQYAPAERVRDYATILVLAMGASIAIAFAVSLRLQAILINPILAVTRVAKGVLERRDYSQRVAKTTTDEVGVLVDAFNDMLAEVGNRADKLEESNRTLKHEMEERLLAEAALRAADRRKDEFLATLAHELRNPLAPISNALELLNRASDNPQLAAEGRAMMARQLRQMVRLVDDLMDVSRITTGKLRLVRSKVQLGTVISSAIETAQPLIQASNHELRVRLPPRPVYVNADPMRLAQVFANLLNNAAKYTPPGGHITLTANVDASAVTVTVADSGIGLTMENQPTIFDMFTQAAVSPGRLQSGLGVGLALAKRLVELHDGTLGARSEGKDRGSEFIVRLPRLHAAASSADDTEGGDRNAGGEGKCRVLVVDDNEDSASSLASILNVMGHETLVAYDGRSALAMAGRCRPDLVLLDIGLPGLSGYEVARGIRAEAWGGTMYLVAVTGWGQVEDKQKSAAAGFDMHMVKPMDMASLAAIVANTEAARA